MVHDNNGQVPGGSSIAVEDGEQLRDAGLSASHHPEWQNRQTLPHNLSQWIVALIASSYFPRIIFGRLREDNRGRGV